MEEHLSKIVDFLGMIFSTLEETKIQQERHHKQTIEILTNIKETLDSQKGTRTNATSVSNSIKRDNPNKPIQMPGGWEELLNKRKHSYYNKIRTNGIHNIYKDFIEQSVPFIPPKFREKPIPGQSEAHANRVKLLEIQKIKVEMERLKDQAQKNEDTLVEVDKAMKILVSEYNEPDDRQYVLEKWYEHIKLEEDKSLNIWEKRKQFFLNTDATHPKNNMEINRRPSTSNRNRTTHSPKSRMPNPENQDVGEVGDIMDTLASTLQNLMKFNNKRNFPTKNQKRYRR